MKIDLREFVRDFLIGGIGYILGAGVADGLIGGFMAGLVVMAVGLLILLVLILVNRRSE